MLELGVLATLGQIEKECLRAERSKIGAGKPGELFLRASREGIHILAQLYLGDRDRKNPLAAPTHANLAGLPPMLVQTGTSETQFDDTVLFADKLEKAGVDVTLEAWKDMLHVFQMFPAFPDAHRAVERIGSFLRSKMGV